MVAGCKMSRRSLKGLVGAAAIAGLHCGGKTTIYLGTSPGEANVAEGGRPDVGTGQGGAAGSMINCPVGGCVTPAACDPGAITSVKGKVFDPAGKVPLYNVIVYNPSGDLDPIPDGVQCGVCDGKASGDPVAAALTFSAGEFQLDDVIVNADSTVTIVTQIGKWRRTTRVPVTACKMNAIADGELRLPRNSTEGELPRIAVTTGHSDALECLLLKIGIDKTQFTTVDDPNDPKKQKHVHMYVGCPNGDNYGASQFSKELGGATFPGFKALLGDPVRLASYDMIVMSCEGTQCGSEKRDYIKVVKDYADGGGRLFLDHDHFYWLRSGQSPWPDTADYVGADKDNLPSPFTSKIDATFPKGNAFSQWLFNVHGSRMPGIIDIYNARFSVRAAIPPDTRQWIYTDENPQDPSGNAVQYMTMNTPVELASSAPDKQCGRVVYTDLHVVTDDNAPIDFSDAAHPFPTGCSPSELTAQEKALEFMLFDLSSCVLPDSRKQVPPAIIR
jgi:hypothetical protein